MINEQITQPTWVSVKLETRQKLREIFLIPMTGNTEVINDEFGKGRVISDGCTNENLKAITVEKLQDFLGSVPTNVSLHDLFKMAVDKIEKVEPIKEVDNTIRINELRGVIDGLMKELDSLVTKEMTTVDNKLKCEHCAFQTASQFALRMHKGKAHPKR